MPQPHKQPSKRFFERSPDGGVRLRIRFNSDQASMMEEAAGDEPVMDWLHRTLEEAARTDVRAARARRSKVRPE